MKCFLSKAQGIASDLVGLRRKLHGMPEVGLNLPATQRAILDSISPLGLEMTVGREASSVVAVLRGGRPGPVVLLRGDMDALPIREETGLPWAPSPESPYADAMHACGHDLHVACLVGAARLLTEQRESLCGSVIFMFQPGEEGWDGASVMLREGVLDAAGERPIAAFGLHVQSMMFDRGIVALRPGALMASSAALTIEIQGAGGHGSKPHLARDPVSVGAEIVLGLQTVVTRQFDIFDPVVISVGEFHSGVKRNIIPDRALIEATVRTFSGAAQARLMDSVERLSSSIAGAHGLTARVTFRPEYPLTVNSPEEFEFAKSVATEIFGPSRVIHMDHPSSGSEDFSRVLEEVPGAYMFLGARRVDGEDSYTNHSARAVFDDSVVPDGAALLATLAAQRLTSATVR